MSHTPGPWTAGEAAWYSGRNPDDTESGKRPISAGANNVIGNIYGADNARLVASAPDLLDALKAACCPACDLYYDQVTALPVLCRHCRMQRAAIAKAEGR